MPPFAFVIHTRSPPNERVKGDIFATGDVDLDIEGDSFPGTRFHSNSNIEAEPNYLCENESD